MQKSACKVTISLEALFLPYFLNTEGDCCIFFIVISVQALVSGSALLRCKRTECISTMEWAGGVIFSH